MAAPSTTPTPTVVSSSTQTAPGPFFVTPALTTIFTPPPECTKGHLTMLQSAQYQVWLNEPRPVANTTFSTCYPPQFMTSFLRSVSSTLVPAFSPLVCPDNYFTIFNQTMTARPLYIACCPSGYEFHPPDVSTPGRPAFGGTCFSDILKTSITQYDNQSSSGVMFFATSGQAYAHPFDGFAIETTSTNRKSTLSASLTSLTTDSVANAAATISGTPLGKTDPNGRPNAGMIAGLAIGLGLGAALLLAAAFFLVRSRKRKHKETSYSSDESMHPSNPPWTDGTINELPSPPIKDNTPPVMRMRSELSIDSETNLQKPPVYHEMATDHPGALNHPDR